MLDLLNPYAHVMRLRRFLFARGVIHSSHPGIPVISVGNLSMGGSGKSPVVMMIARHLQARGKRVGIVSRGYRRKSKGQVIVADGISLKASVEGAGDEALMVATRLPGAIVIVDENRHRGVTTARELGAQVAILDDAYQHVQIKRDLNILLVDASRSLSLVLPFGRHREPISAARAADVLLFTHAEEKLKVRNHWERLKPYISSDVTIAAIESKPDRLSFLWGQEYSDLDTIRNKRVLALSSIASPKHFHRMLEAAGAEIVIRALGDHAEYSKSLAIAIQRDAERSGVDLIVTTEKDAVKAQPFFAEDSSSIPVRVLSQRLEFLSGEQSLWNVIDRIV